MPSFDSISQHSSNDKSFILSFKLLVLYITPFTLKNLFTLTLYFSTQPLISSLVGVLDIKDLNSTSILLFLSQSLAFLTLVHFE